MTSPGYVALDLRGLVGAFSGGLIQAEKAFAIRGSVLTSLARYRRAYHVPPESVGVPMYCELGGTFLWIDSTPFDGRETVLHGHTLHYRSECARCGSKEHVTCAVALGKYRPGDIIEQWVREASEREETRKADERARTPLPSIRPELAEPSDVAELSAWMRDHQEHIRLVRSGLADFSYDTIRRLRSDWERDARAYHAR